MTTHEMFRAAVERLQEHGTGEFLTSLPQALRNVAAQYEVAGELNGIERMVLRAAARRLDEIAGEIHPNGDTGTWQLAADLRAFANERAAV